MSVRPTPRVRASAVMLQQTGTPRTSVILWAALVVMALVGAADGGVVSSLLALAGSHPFLLMAALWLAVVMRSMYSSDQRSRALSTRAIFRANLMHAPRNRRVA